MYSVFPCRTMHWSGRGCCSLNLAYWVEFQRHVNFIYIAQKFVSVGFLISTFCYSFFYGQPIWNNYFYNTWHYAYLFPDTVRSLWMVGDLFETAVCRCSTLFGNESCNVNLVNSLFVFLKTCSETIRATGCSGQQFEHITLPSPLEICYYHFAVWGSKNCIYCPNFEVFQVPLH